MEVVDLQILGKVMSVQDIQINSVEVNYDILMLYLCSYCSNSGLLLGGIVRDTFRVQMK